MLKIYQLRLPQNTFEVTLKYKGVSVRVSFVDGNNYRDIPAKCYTNDPFKQRAIEASQLFKDNEIVLERTVEDESDRKKAAEKAARLQARQARAHAYAQTPKAPETPLNPETPLTPADDAGGSSGGDGLEKMTFDNLAEAIIYIATNYQAQVQTPNEARNFLKERGIKATIKQG